MMFTKPELSFLLKFIRERLEEVQQGIHLYYLNRTNKSMTQEELLPKMKEEINLLINIRNKLWRMKKNHDITSK